MNTKIVLATALCFLESAAVAANFEGKQFSWSANMEVGSLLYCERRDARMLKQRSPKSFAWARSQGLAEESAATGTASYTAKVTTRDSDGARTLIVGCWVAKEIVQESIDGRIKVFAKGEFQINDAIRTSPLAKLAICKKKKPGLSQFVVGDFSLAHEVDATACTSNHWQESIAPLSKAERETALFALRQTFDKKGYTVAVGF